MLVIGIKEGAEIARCLLQEGHPLKVMAANVQCREQMIKSGLQEHLLNEQEVEQLEDILNSHARVLVDASTETNSQICSLVQNRKDKPVYIRYFREELELSPDPLIITVYSFEEAVNRIVEMKAGTVFLTTGSYRLDHFTGDPRLRATRIVARVLPEWKIIKRCQDLNLESHDIVAMQGPFSKRLNKILFKTYNADVIVSRDSGKMGGVDTKVLAALELKIPIIMIKREIPGEYLTACGMPQLLEILDQTTR